MNKGINYAVCEFQENIANMISDVTKEIPITSIKFVLLDVLNQVLQIESQQIVKEKEQYLQESTQNKE